MEANEILSQEAEYDILLQVISLISQRLPPYIKKYYQLKFENWRLMDMKLDIFNNIYKFVEDI